MSTIWIKCSEESLFCEGRTEEAKKLFAATERNFNVDGPIVDFSEGKTQKALLDLKKVLPSDQCEPREAVRAYGMMLYSQGETEKAYQHLRRSVEEAGTPAFYWAVFLLSARDFGRTNEANSLVENKLAVFPGNLWAVQLTRLSLSDQNLGDTLRGIQEKDAGIRNQYQGEAYYVAGEIARMNGESRVAQGYFEQTTNLSCRCSFAHILAAARLRATLSPGSPIKGSDQNKKVP